MTKKLQTVFVFILLLLGINCKKESTIQSSVGANANQLTVAASSADNLSVNLVYQLDYDWGCTGTVYNDYLTLHSDGTWTDGYYTGLWVREKT
ncbi:MAG TPA: hypothetical protein PL045_08150, partial [Chitinophagaceae bacterium]|nr:hypothetical protein [Chitinophagaceae bacterium]